MRLSEFDAEFHELSQDYPLIPADSNPCSPKYMRGKLNLFDLKFLGNRCLCTVKTHL